MKSRSHTNDYFAQKFIYFAGQVKRILKSLYKFGNCWKIHRFACRKHAIKGIFAPETREVVN